METKKQLKKQIAILEKQVAFLESVHRKRTEELNYFNKMYKNQVIANDKLKKALKQSFDYIHELEAQIEIWVVNPRQ